MNIKVKNIHLIIYTCSSIFIRLNPYDFTEVNCISYTYESFFLQGVFKPYKYWGSYLKVDILFFTELYGKKYLPLTPLLW